MGLTIGKLATAAGIGVETIRYYERVGLLTPRGRTAGGFRQYDEESVERLRFVQRATALGFSLAETRELLALRARPGARCAAVRARAQAKLEALEARLRELTLLRDAVARLVGACCGETAVAHCNILLEIERSSLAPPQLKEPACRPPAKPPVSRASRPARSASTNA